MLNTQTINQETLDAYNVMKVSNVGNVPALSQSQTKCQEKNGNNCQTCTCMNNKIDNGIELNKTEHDLWKELKCKRSTISFKNDSEQVIAPEGNPADYTKPAPEDVNLWKDITKGLF